MRSPRSLLLFITIVTFTTALSIDSSKTKLATHSATADTSKSSDLIPTTANHQLSRRQHVFPMWFPTADNVNELVFVLLMGISIANIAFQLLWKLYTYILGVTLNAIANEIARRPEMNQLVIEAGHLRWEFGCTMTEPLPIEFLEKYFQSRRDAIERGFASVYSKEWWSERGKGNTRLCFAGMRVVGEGGVVVPPEGRG
ncbi:MAG: hypothetical protein L6R36_003930 [Xanthoria steineri]|nr:MAG: hypothetical protein L6R36_003930 [Xanthoria steineri]